MSSSSDTRCVSAARRARAALMATAAADDVATLDVFGDVMNECWW